uniref:Zinc finger protein 407 n=1 Tax=Electrophorus electricus TaxID=8005 RepID=A0AAY5EJM3_ELEEL
MDHSKRKLRSGKGMKEEEGLCKNKDSPTNIGTEKGLSACKRAKVATAEPVDRSLSQPHEKTQDDSEYIQTDLTSSLEMNNSRACCFCDFVGKTPTALKIHSKRKHSWMRKSSHSEVVSKKNFAITTVPDIKEMENNPGTPEKGDTCHPQYSAAESHVEMSLLIPQDANTVQKSQILSSYQIESNSTNQCTVNEAESEMTEKHFEMPVEENSSPTQMLLEMVDPSLSGSKKNERHDEKALVEVKGIESAQVGSVCTSNMDVEDFSKQDEFAHKQTSRRCPKPKILHACSYCGHEFRDRPSLETHVKRRHTKEMNYFCEYCSYSCVAKCDYEKHCMSNKHKRKMIEKKTSEVETDLAPKPALPGMRAAGGTTEHQCSSCGFTTSTSVMLAQHAKLQHPPEHRLHCQACHYYTSTTEGMQAHLAGESHQQAALEKNIGPLFEDCVEKVLVILSDDQKDEQGKQQRDISAGELGAQCFKRVSAVQAAEITVPEENLEVSGPHKKKRGRPKMSYVTTCSHCGLIASNPTNLSVHIRRRHSRLYSFFCKLCNYYCVTKGDMDRHCETKKHLKRMQSSGDGCSGIVSLDAEQAAHASEEEAVWAVGTEKAEEEKNANETEKTQTDVSAKKSKDDLENSCVHCDFVAHSTPSLALHVRRKHTQDFEFVCLACTYYAVTRREMSRHAATEKHKQKRETYLEKGDGSLEKDLTELNQRMQLDPSNPIERVSEDAHQPTGADGGLLCSDPLGGISSTRVIGCTAKAVAGIEGSEDELSHSIMVVKPSGTSLRAETKDSSPDQTDSNVPASVQSSTTDSNAVDEDTEDNYIDDDLSETRDASSEKLLLRAAPFDSCIFHLKVLTEGQQEAVVGEPTTTALRHQGLRRREVAVKGVVPNPRIRCEDCGFLADGLSGLNVHISMKHPSKEKHFHCLLCGKSFYTESNLQQHLGSAAHIRNEQGSIEELPEGGASFKCVRCNEPCQTEQELFMHIKEKHEELLREVNKYVLEDTEQINREREENQGSVCKYCGKVCKSSNSMAFLAHVRTHTGSKPFRCKICNFATAQLGDARNHVKRHLGMREYKCHICGWAFVMKKHLNTHLLGKHGLGQPKERKYECEICDRSFSERWALNNHMKLHTGDKPYKCTWPSCHYAFLTLSAMKDHYRTHTGEKSFLCDLCGFAGGTRHALTKHRRQHTGTDIYTHIHTCERPFRCQSNCAENIRKHILHTGKHEGVMMYNCPKCDYATNAPMDFRNHLKEMHPDIENPDLAYLHAGIVSKSFECRLKGQGASYVEAETAFTPDEGRQGVEALQQVIIIQGYGEGEVMEQALEESAAATLQTLAMSGHVAEVLHITEDGQVIPCDHKVASSGAQLTQGPIQLPEGATQYVLVNPSGSAPVLGDQVEHTLHERGQNLVRGSQMVTESSTALDALLCAVSELGQKSEANESEIITNTVGENGTNQGERHGEVEVYSEVLQSEGVESIGVVAQVVGHTHKATAEGVVQEVLQFAANQLMMKEGLTQVIVNDEGTHYIVTELDDSTLQVEGTVYTQQEVARPEEGQVETVEQSNEKFSGGTICGSLKAPVNVARIHKTFNFV